MAANVSQSALEQEKWLAQNMAAAKSEEQVAVLNMFCLHHQACLAKRPIILSIAGIASGQWFEKGLDFLKIRVRTCSNVQRSENHVLCAGLTWAKPKL